MLSEHAKMEARQFVFKTNRMYTHAKLVKAWVDKHGHEGLKEIAQIWDFTMKWYEERIPLANLEPTIGEILDENPGWSAHAFLLSRFSHEDQLQLLPKAKTLGIEVFRREVHTYIRALQPKLVMAVRTASIDKKTWAELGQETAFIYEDDPRSKMTNEEIEKEFEACDDDLPFRDKVIGITRAQGT